MLDTIDDTLGVRGLQNREEERGKSFVVLGAEEKTCLLQQKSRNKWLVDGDENSGFFHNFINRRRKGNEISGLLVEGN